MHALPCTSRGVKGMKETKGSRGERAIVVNQSTRACFSPPVGLTGLQNIAIAWCDATLCSAGSATVPEGPAVFAGSPSSTTMARCWPRAR